MAEVSKMKLRLLYLLDILKKHTDELHPLSSTELIELLNKKGLASERKSLYRDISSLEEFGYEIFATRTPKPGFFLASRNFELPEIQILLDAILAAPFISPKKTRELSKKLCSFLSEYQAGEVYSQDLVNQRVKFENEEIYYTIDALHRAIANRKKVRFQYYHRVIRENEIVFDQGREFILSPYALLWSNDRYYLAGNYEKYDTVGNYRLDRMRRVEVLSETARPFEEISDGKAFDSADYMKKSFHMFCGEQKEVVLRCSLTLLEAVLDKFGMGLTIMNATEESFDFRCKVYTSNGLMEWILQYGALIEVLEPVDLRNQIKREIEKLWQKYS